MPLFRFGRSIQKFIIGKPLRVVWSRPRLDEGNASEARTIELELELQTEV